MANSISSLGLPIGSASITTTVGSNVSSSARISRNMEDVYEFLKDNMRVAEYRDGNSKLENVELQLRLGPGYEWEPIKRTKIIRSKI